MLREQIRLGCLCADRRQVYDSAWTCCLNRRSQRGGYRPRLAKVRRRIEVRRNEHEDPVHSPKGRRKRRRVVDICFDQVAPLPISRTTARTGWPAAKRLRATSPPTLPVIPVTANIGYLLASRRREPCRAMTMTKRLSVQTIPDQAARNESHLGSTKCRTYRLLFGTCAQQSSAEPLVAGSHLFGAR